MREDVNERAHLPPVDSGRNCIHREPVAFTVIRMSNSGRPTDDVVMMNLVQVIMLKMYKIKALTNHSR